jgi:hypothetical protein
MAWNTASIILLILFLSGCISTHKTVINESTKSSTEDKEIQSISLVEDAILNVRKDDASTFDSIAVTGKLFVVTVEYVPGKKRLGIGRRFNSAIEGESPSSFILVIGERKIAPFAYRDNSSDEDQKIHQVEEQGDNYSGLSIISKATTSLFFDLPAYELNQPKKLILTIELQLPQEKRTSVQVDLK